MSVMCVLRCFVGHDGQNAQAEKRLGVRFDVFSLFQASIKMKHVIGALRPSISSSRNRADLAAEMTCAGSFAACLAAKQSINSQSKIVARKPVSES
jgi:hypothetical protein